MSRLHASEDRRKGRDDVIESILNLAFHRHNAVSDSVRSAVRPSQAAGAAPVFYRFSAAALSRASRRRTSATCGCSSGSAFFQRSTNL
jgi:hypothetical protein